MQHLPFSPPPLFKKSSKIIRISDNENDNHDNSQDKDLTIKIELISKLGQMNTWFISRLMALKKMSKGAMVAPATMVAHGEVVVMNHPYGRFELHWVDILTPQRFFNIFASWWNIVSLP
jgi:hypothetical protein